MSSYYCVLAYPEGEVVYLGRNLTAAANRAAPGTVYSSGRSRLAAHEQAKNLARLQHRRLTKQRKALGV